MPDQTITIRLPDGFDAVLREHAALTGAPISDDLRRAYVATLLASIMDGLQAPVVADGFIRLNGGNVIPMGDHDRIH